MKEKEQHWTASSIKDFVYRVSSDFVLQVEKQMHKENLSQKQLAKRVELSEGRVSQILNNPGNMTLKKMVEFARGLGMKLAVVAYDDADPENINGPINSQIFQICWERLGSPTDFFEVGETIQVMHYSSVTPTSVVWKGEGVHWEHDPPLDIPINLGHVGKESSSDRRIPIGLPAGGQEAATVN